MQHNHEQWDYAIYKVKMIKGKRTWSSLPASFELDAVKVARSDDYLTSLVKPAIRGRIKVKQAQTFTELIEAIGIARAEIDRQFNKAIA